MHLYTPKMGEIPILSSVKCISHSEYKSIYIFKKHRGIKPEHIWWDICEIIKYHSWIVGFVFHSCYTQLKFEIQIHPSNRDIGNTTYTPPSSCSVINVDWGPCGNWRRRLPKEVKYVSFNIFSTGKWSFSGNGLIQFFIKTTLALYVIRPVVL